MVEDRRLRWVRGVRGVVRGVRGEKLLCVLLRRKVRGAVGLAAPLDSEARRKTLLSAFRGVGEQMRPRESTESSNGSIVRALPRACSTWRSSTSTGRSTNVTALMFRSGTRDMIESAVARGFPSSRQAVLQRRMARGASTKCSVVWVRATQCLLHGCTAIRGRGGGAVTVVKVAIRGGSDDGCTLDLASV